MLWGTLDAARLYGGDSIGTLKCREWGTLAVIWGWGDGGRGSGSPFPTVRTLEAQLFVLFV